MRRRSEKQKTPFQARWGSSEGNLSTLEEIRQRLKGKGQNKKGQWYHNSLFELIHVAYKWKITPSEFFALSNEDKWFMIAYLRCKGTMEDWSKFVNTPKPPKNKGRLGKK